MIGERLRLIRREKNMSQGDTEDRTGLQRCYVSRVENGHTIPSLETLQKMALEIPLSFVVGKMRFRIGLRHGNRVFAATSPWSKRPGASSIPCCKSLYYVQRGT